MRGQMVRCWHPDSPGSTVVVWRPWWRRKRKPFATLAEVIRYCNWSLRLVHGQGLDVTGRKVRCPRCEAEFDNYADAIAGRPLRGDQT